MPCLCLALVACGGAAKTAPVAPPSVSDHNIFIRSAMDTDPSAYLGRFVRDDAAVEEIDEVNAAKLACSGHYRIRKVDAGGVTFDHYYRASARAAVGLSIPRAAGVTAGAAATQGQVVRVRFELTDKWIADLADPVAFAECCQRQPDQCTGRVVGEFLGGTGTIFHAGNSVSEGGVSAAGVGVEVKDGVEWRQATEFGTRRPVFFAFKLTSTTATGSAPAPCWIKRPDCMAEDGASALYFVGRSEQPLANAGRPTREAFHSAQVDAERQYARFLAVDIQSSTYLQTLFRESERQSRYQYTVGTDVNRTVSDLKRVDEYFSADQTADSDASSGVVYVLIKIAKEDVEKHRSAIAAEAQARADSPEPPSEWVASIFNVDDSVAIYVNGQRVNQCSFSRSCKIKLNPHFRPGRNQVRLEYSNDVGIWTYGYEILKDDEVMYTGQCGKVWLFGCGYWDVQRGVVHTFEFDVDL